MQTTTMERAEVLKPSAPLPVREAELSDEELECVVGGLSRPWEQRELPWHASAETK
jgi:bacteriocin-like protein